MSTIGWWIDLPTSGGASDRLALDEPGGAGLFQIAASNACLACRENELRTLWEDFGTSDVHGDLLIAGDPSTFDWRAEDDSGIWVRHAGIFRVRLYGETAALPRLHFAARGYAPSGEELGIVLAVSRGATLPDATSPIAFVTTSATSLVDLAVDLTLHLEDLVTESLTLQSEGDAVSEAGVYTTASVWVGAWCTSGSDAAKGSLYGASVLLREPS